MDKRELIAELTRRGLVAEISQAPAASILGGRSGEATRAGVDVYREAFIIHGQTGAWTVAASRRGRPDLEQVVGSLDEALLVVLRAYEIEV